MLESEAYNFKDVFLNKAKVGKGNKCFKVATVEGKFKRNIKSK